MNALLIDSREQSPLNFKDTEHYEVKTEKLCFGDYAIKCDDRLLCVIERKSASDLIGTITSGHDRFKAELERAKKSGIDFYIMVEESYFNIINKTFEGAYNIKMKGFIIAKILAKMQVRYKLNIIFFNNRQEMQSYIRCLFQAYLEEEEKDGKLKV